MMDDDFEDLLDDGDELLRDEEMDKELLTRASAIPKTVPEPKVSTTRKINQAAMPSENELRLGRRVLELEKERDDIAAELAILKARFPSHSTTIPISTDDSAPSTTTNVPIEIPPELLPVLAILRRHIAELTRDNQALRYTFIGRTQSRRRSLTVNPRAGPVSPQAGSSAAISPSAAAEAATGFASSSKLTLDVPMTPSLSSDSAPPVPNQTTESPMFQAADLPGLRLEDVVDRVKELLIENEELGEMILEAGKKETDDWEQALQESKSVITSLDADLTHHAGILQTVREELATYKRHFGPIPDAKNDRAAGSNTTQGLSIRGAGSGGGPSWRAGRSSEGSGSRGGSDSGRPGGNGGSGLKRHERDGPSNAPGIPRGAGGGGGSGGGRGGDRPHSSTAHGQGRATNGHDRTHGYSQGQERSSGSSRNDDRGSKRRR